MLKLVDVEKSYKLDRARQAALRGVSLSVMPGESIAITGPSGSGKSTLLNLAGLLDSPDRGEVHFLGKRVDSVPERARTILRRDGMGFVFQRFHLIPVLSALENVALPALLRSASGARASARAEALLEQVGLACHRAIPAARLSGGQRQRVAIARALINDPELILADEPTANLDEHSGKQVLDLLFGMSKARGRALLIVTHDPAVAARADRTIRIQDGLIPNQET